MYQMLSFTGPLASVTRSHLDSGLYSPVMSDSTRGWRLANRKPASTTDGLPLEPDSRGAVES